MSEWPGLTEKLSLTPHIKIMAWNPRGCASSHCRGFQWLCRGGGLDRPYLQSQPHPLDSFLPLGERAHVAASKGAGLWPLTGVMRSYGTVNEVNKAPSFCLHLFFLGFLWGDSIKAIQSLKAFWKENFGWNLIFDDFFTPCTVLRLPTCRWLVAKCQGPQFGTKHAQACDRHPIPTNSTAASCILLA